ncbi:hypothetical protein HPB50_007964 [Hyalomma asiaticum]|uniref:Uncharacterized protein n=1 Tax=Hyalomma asiaticum TaxID=266040 RepID=A0ACB7S8N0_HYAAI|nr:hypothetical protein HPB50_007964 [Hyalomma asiaticum]
MGSPWPSRLLKQVLRQLQLLRLMIERLSERIERAQPAEKSCGPEVKPALVKEAFASLEEFEEFDGGTTKVREQLVRRKENVVEDHLKMQVILPLTIIELPCKSPARHPFRPGRPLARSASDGELGQVSAFRMQVEVAATFRATRD